MNRFVLVGALIVMSVAHAQQFAMPTDTDLKTAYCIRIKQRQRDLYIGLLAKEPSASPAYPVLQKYLRETDVDLSRLRTYLLPKVPVLDPTGLLGATNRADADMNQAVSVETDQCLRRCAPSLQNGQITPEWSACSNQCAANNPTSVRIHSCTDVNWLPF